MVDIKSAVAAAMEFAKNSLGSERTSKIRLEEIESSNVDGNDEISCLCAGCGYLA
jgi:hypothetical protein